MRWYDKLLICGDGGNSVCRGDVVQSQAQPWLSIRKSGRYLPGPTMKDVPSRIEQARCERRG